MKTRLIYEAMLLLAVFLSDSVEAWLCSVGKDCYNCTRLPGCAWSGDTPLEGNANDYVGSCIASSDWQRGDDPARCHDSKRLCRIVEEKPSALNKTTYYAADEFVKLYANNTYTLSMGLDHDGNGTYSIPSYYRCRFVLLLNESHVYKVHLKQPVTKYVNASFYIKGDLYQVDLNIK